MMAFYYTKADLFGIPRGRVERFTLAKAAPLMAEGKLEPFDERKHAGAHGAECVPANPKTGQTNGGKK